MPHPIDSINLTEVYNWISSTKNLTTAALVAVVCFMKGHLLHHPILAANKYDLLFSKRLQNYHDTILPTLENVVKTGDLITRLGSDITSTLLAQLNDVDPSYSHCGIISKEMDTIFVYHALGGEFNPTQKLRRETLYSFGHPSENKSLGIFRPSLSPTEKAKLFLHIRYMYAIGLPFDMKFDYDNSERQYCAEFVAKAFAKAWQNDTWFSFTYRGHFKYAAVDQLFLNKKMQPIGRFIY